MLVLRNYQKQCLDQLKDYLSLVGKLGASTAFYHLTKRQYRSMPRLPELPYACLRVPTGGGKTLMACHALSVVTREYLQQQRTVCLWLVPSNAIREQTLKALRDRSHPYRQVIDAQFTGNVSVMDLAEALYVQRGTLEGDTCIIVSTLAALRVEDTEGRKIFESSGALQHHFTGLPPVLQTKLERNGAGTISYSLANVLRLWEPTVIMDEAHNARTKLSFETLERFSPSCIIEFTATPQTEHDPARGKYASNVLAHVSAAQLKAEPMIKLPVRLHTRPHWQEILVDTVAAQRDLEQVAKSEQTITGEYIRPIVLIQAQPHRKGQDNATADVVRTALLENCKVPEEEIAVATGATREIEGVNLFDAGCPIRFIITQQALKEGWDCSFAYIFCSLADIGSARDVEQLLGRVLRLPAARSKQRDELNRAYAMISSQRFLDTLEQLAEALVENGFQAMEARQFVSHEQPALPWLPGPLFAQRQVTERVPEHPDLSKLDENLRQRVTYSTFDGALVVSGALTPSERTALESCFTSEEGKRAVQRIYESTRGRIGALAEVPDAIMVPALCVRVDGQLELFEETHFLDANWNLADCDPILTEGEFSSDVVDGADGEVDVTTAGRIEARFVQQLRKNLALLRTEGGWTLPGLVNWLDRQIPHPDITRTQATLFIRKVIEGLMNSRGASADQLAMEKYRLCRAISALIQRHRQGMRVAGYQSRLFGLGAAEIETSPTVPFTISQECYAPNWYYEGTYKFQKHAMPTVGKLKSDGEEFECADIWTSCYR